MTNQAVAGILLAALTLAGSASGQMERIKVSGTSFVREPSGRPFAPWGFNYDRDARGRLIEDYWEHEWPTIEDDFREMKTLGANVVRIHLQFGRFLPEPDRPDTANLERLERLVALAERTGLYLDLTGLGCYHKPAVPKWYDSLDEAGRWAAQARFWREIAGRCSRSPAVFCYDLMNEPVVPGGKDDAGDWLGKGPGFGGKYYVQKISLDRAGRPRTEVARRWLVTLRDAVRERDRRTPITVGLVDWSLDRPGALFSGITPQVAADLLDFVCVHLYPHAGKVQEALDTLKQFALGKPVVVEETFPLACSIAELDRFVQGSRPTAAGVIGFYWGQTPEELQKPASIGDAITRDWLEYFKKTAKPSDSRK